MNAPALRIQAAAVILLVQVSTATQAGYRCDPPATPIDRRACEAALQGPDALRHFVWRMRPIQSLDFHDYVNEATLSAWADRARKEAARPADKPIASSDR